MAHSTGGKSAAKFPLSLHKTGQYRKKIRGRDYYFGTDPDEALKEYLRVKDDLEAGRQPRPFEGSELHLVDLCNHFLTHKKHQVETGEITVRTFEDYHHSCEWLLDFFGKSAAVEQLNVDSLLSYRRKLAKTRKAYAIGTEVQRVRVVLRHAFEVGLIDKPVRFGAFKRPSKSVLRKARAAAEPKFFQAEEISRLLEAAPQPLDAMILLGVNCGMGNADVGTLPLSALALSGGWLDFPRNKTGIPRRCPLWPETVERLQAAIKVQPTPKGDAARGLVFVTKYGGAWHRDARTSSAVSAEFKKLSVETGVYRRQVGFYALRHVFQTVADELGDYVATRRIMGHADDNDMSGHYRERFPDDRLRRVTDHVRTWLFGGRGDGE